MRAKESILVLKSFSIVESECSVIPCAQGNDVKEMLSSHPPVDIDFDILKNKKDIHKKMIVATIEVNPEKQPGYYVKAKGVAVFVISDPSASKKEQGQLVMYSGVSICITNIRSYIANMTSYYPLGRYNFPSIDVNDLIHQKIGANKVLSESSEE